MTGITITMDKVNTVPLERDIMFVAAAWRKLRPQASHDLSLLIDPLLTHYRRIFLRGLCRTVRIYIHDFERAAASASCSTSICTCL